MKTCYRRGAQQVVCFALATAFATLCLVSAASSRGEKIFLDLNRRALGTSTGTAMQGTIAGKKNIATIIQTKKGSSTEIANAPLLREPAKKVPTPQHITTEPNQCEKHGGDPPNEKVTHPP